MLNITDVLQEMKEERLNRNTDESELVPVAHNSSIDSTNIPGYKKC
jgi:hypothetical protein